MKGENTAGVWRHGFAPATVVDILTERSVADGARTAYRFLEGDTAAVSITYADLRRRSGELAAHLRRIVPEQGRVLICQRPGLDFIVTLFACFIGRLIAVPAYPPRGSHLPTSLQLICDDCSPGAVVLDAVSARDFTLRSHEAAPEIVIAPLTPQSEAWLDGGPRADDLALLQYTSGSTGRPKGVMVRHGNLMANLEQQRRLYGADAGSRGVIWLPPYHDMGLGSGILQPLYAGSAMTLLSPLHAMQRPLRWLQSIHETGATVSGGPPFAYAACVNSVTDEQRDKLDLSHWRCAFVGAEPIVASVLEDFAARFEPCGFDRRAFQPSYGLAEATLLVAGAAHGVGPKLSPMDFGGSAPRVSCGAPTPDIELLVVDPEEEIVAPEGAQGEIWLRGPSVAHGYWNDPELTRTVFDAYLADGRGPYLRTGDIGVFAKGELTVAGRIKDIIIVSGRKVHAEDVETSLRLCGELELLRASAAALAVEINGVERLVILIELRRTTAQAHGARLRAAVVAAVGRNQGVSVADVQFVAPGALPRTSSGKVRRHLCAPLYAARAPQPLQATS